MVSEQRNYKVLNTEEAKKIVLEYLRKEQAIVEGVVLGLPEIHDRYDVWNVPLVYYDRLVGEITVNAFTGEINNELSSDLNILKERLNKEILESKNKSKNKKNEFIISTLNNMVIKGRSELVLSEFTEQSIDMVFTSPPYYNARKAYSEFATYEDYLNMIRQVVRQCNRTLIDGKFFIINSSNVLVPRATRNESSRRIAVPFDIHQICLEEGFEFMEDIIWQKPEGAGWASGRGRRFSADRNPLQYKAVPTTEYVMVYRKKPTILIDHFIRNHPNKEIIERSKIEDGYEKTNVWYISPMRDKRHPAVFPSELAEKVITYYSFVNDVVLDPFGGIGTTARAALKLGRRFITIDMSEEYIKATLDDLGYGGLKFNDGTDIKYLDQSHLKNPTLVNRKVEDVIKSLRVAGVSDEEIISALDKIF
jgi:DNA modification methylase